MSVPRAVTEVLAEHVTLEVESIDRMYLNVYVPVLQRDGGVVGFFRHHRGQPVPSSALMAPMTRQFVGAIEAFAVECGVPVVKFEKGQRKDDVAQQYLRRFGEQEGVFLLGKAQEKASVFRTEGRKDPDTGRRSPWLMRSTALVNQYYFYCLDEDFGPLFLKFCSYFPYNAKLCLNGHEYLKRQLAKRGIAYEALDNGILSCAEPRRLQALCEGLTEHTIDRVLRKWLRRLPHPFTAADRRAGYRYDLSILQAEFSLTQVVDQPLCGRMFFEEVIREHLDLGRPDQVQLIFNRRVHRRTPGRFRTRVLTEGVIPSLHVDYKHSRIKQYFKLGRALRTETTINDTRDFGIGKRLQNLPALRQLGFQANRRLLDVQTRSHDCWISEEALGKVVRPVEVSGQRASALRFDDPGVQALLTVLLLFVFQIQGFTCRQLRQPLAHLLGKSPADLTPGRMTYDLRRLRLHGLLQRIPKSHRYRLTPLGLRVALFFSRTYARLLRPGFAHIVPGAPPGRSRLRECFDRLDHELDRYCKEARLTA
jgi:hypothetical protein